MQRTIRRGALVIALLVVAISAFRLWEIGRSYRKANQVYRQTADRFVQQAPADTQPVQPHGEKIRQAPISVDFDGLKRENPDVVGWLYCPGTVINYPVVQAADNEQYLSRMLDGSYHAAGTIFLDCRCDGSFQSSNSILYGHNMRDDSMFGTLEYYEEPAYWTAHPKLYLLTPEADYEVRLLVGRYVPLDDEIYEADWTPEALREYLHEAMGDSSLDAGCMEVERVLTLSTCGAGTQERRYILIGAMTELGRGETGD